MHTGDLLEPGTGASASTVPWPAAPHYFDLTGSTGAVAWVRYRMWAADWHTRTLREVAGPTKDYDRLVGVEMALDGALNNLSGAFDAATALLIEGAEATLDVDEDDRLPVHQYSWNRTRKLLAQPAIGTNPDGTANDGVWRVILDVDNALDGERDLHPSGWLAQLRRLRNRIAHRDTLARHHAVEGSGAGTVLSLGGRSVDAFTYLASACDQVHDLTEQMVSLAIRIGAPEVRAGFERPSWDLTRRPETGNGQ